MMQSTQNRVAASRILAVGMLLAALMAASLLLASSQATRIEGRRKVVEQQNIVTVSVEVQRPLAKRT